MQAHCRIKLAAATSRVRNALPSAVRKLVARQEACLGLTCLLCCLFSPELCDGCAGSFEFSHRPTWLWLCACRTESRGPASSFAPGLVAFDPAPLPPRRRRACTPRMRHGTGIAFPAHCAMVHPTRRAGGYIAPMRCRRSSLLTMPCSPAARIEAGRGGAAALEVPLPDEVAATSGTAESTTDEITKHRSPSQALTMRPMRGGPARSFCPSQPPVSILPIDLTSRRQARTRSDSPRRTAGEYHVFAVPAPRHR